MSGRLSGDWIERVGSVGFAAKGVLYLVIGLLALFLAFGTGSGQQASQTGALRTLAAQPYGTALLWIVAVGLAAYALLRLFHLVVNPSGERGPKGAVVRTSYLVRAVVYAGLAAYAAAIVTGSASSSGAGSGSTQHLTAQILALDHGAWLVGAVGMVMVGVGLYQLRQGVTKRFARVLRPDVTGTTRDLLVRAGTAGHLSRGVVFGLIGWFLIQTAVTHDPSDSGGIDHALKELAAAPYGTVLLAVVALGFVAYGLFSAALARYGRTRLAD